MEWFGSITGIIGAIWLSLNMSTSRWAYPFFLSSSLVLLLWAFLQNHEGILWQQSVFTVINIIGIYRWFLPKNRRSGIIYQHDEIE